MNRKYKLNEVAKDLKVDNKDVGDVVKKYFDREVKSTTSLTDKELDVVFQHFTKKNEMKTLDAYFSVTTKDEKKPEAPKPKAPKKEKTVKKTDENKTTKKEKEEIKQPMTEKDNKKIEKTKETEVKKEAEVKKETGVQPPKPIGTMSPSQMTSNERPNRYNGDRPRNNNNNQNGDRPRNNNNNQNGDRPRYNNNNQNGDRPRYNNNNQNGDRPAYNNNNQNGDRPRYNNNSQNGDRPRYNNNNQNGDRPRYNNNNQNGDRPAYNNNNQNGDRPRYNNNNQNGDRPRYNNNNQNGDRPAYNNNNQNGDRPRYNNNNQNGDRPRYNNNNQNGDRPRYNNNNQNGDRPRYNNNNQNGDRPRYNNNNGDRPAYNNNNNRPAPTPKPATPVAPPKPQTKPQDRHYEVRTVDTSKVDINLDKYNEKYETIAPAANSKYQNTSRKQKFNNKNAQRQKAKYSTKRETEADKLNRLALQKARKQQLKVLIPDEIVITELAARLKVNVTEVIKKLMLLGVMAGQNEVVDFDTASLVAEELGAKVEKEVIVTIEERLFVEEEETEENLVDRSPIVVVMGHVDHGKTSILDKIRHADVTSTEAGGITQHIGAYQVSINHGGQEKEITFLDTPGHEAFTSMRARGALATDIAILVVAADDGIMPQTIEAINHAKAAGIQIIVAVNKMDKPAANLERVKNELTEHELVPEEWGGDVVVCPVSAHTGEGMDNLLDMVLLTAEMLELKANPNRLAKGTVIESRLDKGRGPIATLLVQTGTLKTGDVIIAGTTVGRVRAMLNDKGIEVNQAGPCVPVEITGLAEVPTAGEEFNIVENERLARELVEQRKHAQKEEVFKQYQKVTLDNLFSQIADGEMKELPIIVKADVNGSAEAVKQSLEKLSNDEVRVRVIHGGVGAVNRSDVMLAQASGALIIGFNVRPDNTAREMCENDEIEIKLYRIIYDAIDDVKQAMKGLYTPKTREVALGRAEVRAVYKITNVGVVAGCYVLDGKVARNALIRVVRDGIVLAEDKIDSLKRFKDDQKEVATGYECGIGLDKFNDIREGDIFESFIIEEYIEDK